MKPLIPFLIVAFLAVPASGDYLRLVPPAPDSNDLIVAEMGGIWKDGCVPRNPMVVRNGNVVTVKLEVPDAVCPPALAPWSERVTIGTLEPGVYTLIVDIPTEAILAPPYASLEFPVTDAEATHTISPNVGPPAGGTEVTILGTLGSCPFAPPCIEPRVLFGGVPATPVREIVGGVVAVTPAHAPGTVDVEVRGLAGSTVVVLPAAFTFHGSGRPDPSAYTPVLVPLIFSGPGAFGSEFVTEATSYNDSDIAITPLNSDAITTCPPNVSPCSAPPFAGGVWGSFHHGASYPNGLVLWLPRSQADDMNFSLHVRDISRATEGAGTNIQVVREAELIDGDIHLLNIPVTSGFRHTIRIYDLGFSDLGLTGSNFVYVEAFSSSNERLRSRVVSLSSGGQVRAVPEGCTPDLPGFAIVSDFVVPVAGVDEVRFVIQPADPSMRLWAFVSITNNSTQQITTVTPE